MFANHKEKVGIVLSGGGAMGFAHIGALQSLEEHRIFPTSIAGTSMGALIGSFYAAGYAPAEIKDIIRKERFDKLLTIFTPSFGLSKLGLSSHKNLEEALDKYIPSDSFDTLPKHLAVCATNLSQRECRYFDSGEGLHDAVIASSSIPGVFEAVRIGSDAYVDGGLFDNLPASTIRTRCNYVIGIDVNPMPQDTPQMDGTIDVMIQTIHTIIHRSSAQGRLLCDYLVEPRVNDKYNAFSFRNFDEIYNEGYIAMNRFLGASPETVAKLSE